MNVDNLAIFSNSCTYGQYYFITLELQLAPLKDKLEENVLHILDVVKHAAVLSLDPALGFVFEMDVSVQMEQS